MYVQWHYFKWQLMLSLRKLIQKRELPSSSHTECLHQRAGWKSLSTGNLVCSYSFSCAGVGRMTTCTVFSIWSCFPSGDLKSLGIASAEFFRVFEGREFSLDLYSLFVCRVGHTSLVCEYKFQKIECGGYEMT